LGHQITQDLKAVDTSRRQAAVVDLVAACRPRGQARAGDLLLDWAGAARLAGLGFAIGSHTVSHPILSRESPSTQQQEISHAREEFGRRLGIEPAAFAYPNGSCGDFTEVTTGILRRSGHALAVTTVRGFNGASADPFAARRVVVDPEQGPAALLQVLRGLAGDRAAPAKTAQQTGQQTGQTGR
jgi:peptidoglycan/xylan/chitin deacetylase (PgdA/CDA1 family)